MEISPHLLLKLNHLAGIQKGENPPGSRRAIARFTGGGILTPGHRQEGQASFPRGQALAEIMRFERGTSMAETPNGASSLQRHINEGRKRGNNQAAPLPPQTCATETRPEKEKGPTQIKRQLGQ